MTTPKLYRVRFCEWQTLAIDVLAPGPEAAIANAKGLRQTRGTLPFEEITGDTADWQAEEIQPPAPLLPTLRRAYEALNSAPCFPVGRISSYAVAAELGRLIRELQGGQA